MTIAGLKRDANTGALFGELVFRFGACGEEIPERLKGKRRLVRSNSVGVFFQNADGAESELRLPRKNLFEYSGDCLRIYSPGLRDLTDDERALLSTWKKKEAEYPDYMNTYWPMKSFFI